MTYLSPLLITIRSTEDGYYRWELHHGPDGAFEDSGHCPLLTRCFEEVIAAERALALDLTRDLDPVPLPPADTTPDHAPIPAVHAPGGPPLPAQQDIPSDTHRSRPRTSIYLLPSRTG